MTEITLPDILFVGFWQIKSEWPLNAGTCSYSVKCIETDSRNIYPFFCLVIFLSLCMIPRCMQSLVHLLPLNQERREPRQAPGLSAQTRASG